MQACSESPPVQIFGSHEFERNRIKNCYQKDLPAAMYVTGSHHTLNHLSIETEQTGIFIENVTKSFFNRIHIQGAELAPGIEIWDSTNNRFEEINIKHVGDGFYLENSPENVFLRNKVSGSRYGLHIMYSDRITAMENQFKENITGLMVMETTGTTIQNNYVGSNTENVNAQGLLLYNVYGSLIDGNTIEENRVGMYIEKSADNEVTGNFIRANFIGAQLNQIERNLFEGNSFINNVNEVQATGSNDNVIQYNYWDGASKRMDNDGISNLSYSADRISSILPMIYPHSNYYFNIRE